jgi:hypothetical protein
MIQTLFQLSYAKYSCGELVTLAPLSARKGAVVAEVVVLTASITVRVGTVNVGALGFSMGAATPAAAAMMCAR